jgi:hypothetical protein
VDWGSVHLKDLVILNEAGGSEYVSYNTVEALQVEGSTKNTLNIYEQSCQFNIKNTHCFIQ